MGLLTLLLLREPMWRALESRERMPPKKLLPGEDGSELDTRLLLLLLLPLLALASWHTVSFGWLLHAPNTGTTLSATTPTVSDRLL